MPRYVYQLNCPYRQRGTKCLHDFKTETRLTKYKWTYPGNINKSVYLRYTKTVEICELNNKKKIAAIKIQQDNDFTHKPTWWETTWWEMRINA